jgi:basic membrane lipoprotein Med (substrate-binding protein (PBP1-ABC) superfamily)
MEQLRQALALWRGSPLAEFADMPFAQPEIARLEELHLSALEEQFELRLSAGESGTLVPDVEALATAHPLRERLAAQLMTALYRGGRQADALAVYRRTRDALDDVGVQPSGSLNRLHSRMLQQDPDLTPRDLFVEAAPATEGARRGRRWRWVAVACLSGLALAGVGAVALRPGGGAGTARAHQPGVVLVIGAPPPTDRGHAVSSAPTLATSLAAGAESLRRQGVSIRIAYAPGASGAADTRTIESAAAHAGLVVIFPPNFESLQLIATAARRHPNTRFAVIDTSFRERSFPPNVAGMPFDNRQLGYLAGYLAALEGGHPPVVSAVAGVPGIVQVEQILGGFRDGARRADPAVRVIVRYSGTFLQRAPCESLANREIDAGSKVVFDVAGTCGLGALDAANLRGVWGIGVDTDLSYLGPAILASAVKRFDSAVELAVQLYLQSQLPRGSDIVLNAGNDGVQLVGLSGRVSQVVRSRVARVAAQLETQATPAAG